MQETVGVTDCSYLHPPWYLLNPSGHDSSFPKIKEERKTVPQKTDLDEIVFKRLKLNLNLCILHKSLLALVQHLPGTSEKQQFLELLHTTFLKARRCRAAFVL